MAALNYPNALKHVLVHEGGYVNHPRDPGGETNKGVTIAVYRAYRARKGLPAQSVRHISDAELNEIYKLQYWNRVRGDQLPAGVDYVVFDGAVNSGPSQSIKWLQRALGCTVDGNMGEGTLAAIEACDDHRALIDRICQLRMGFLRALRTWSTFGTGWTRRVSGVKAVGQAMAVDVAPPRVAHVDTAAAKAKPEDIAEPSALAEATGPAVAASSPISAPVMDTANSLSMFAGINQYIAMVVVILLVMGLGITFYTIYQNHKAKKARNAEAVAEVPEFYETEPAS
jgi:lysozyme family protein